MRTLTGSVYDESGWVTVLPSAIRTTMNPIQWIRRTVKNTLVRFLARNSIILVKTKQLDVKVREQGADWPFLGYTMAGHRRLQNVKACIEEVLANNVPGDFIETGAWRGGTTIFMRAMLKLYGDINRKVYVADSFEGLPVPKGSDDGWDLSNIDYLKVSQEAVENNFRRFGLLDSQVVFLKGWFCDSLPTAPVERLAILRLDGDLYSSTMDALVNLYHKVSPGGFVIVDDYYSWPSCQRAITEFLRSRSENPQLIKIDTSAVYWQIGGVKTP